MIICADTWAELLEALAEHQAAGWRVVHTLRRTDGTAQAMLRMENNR